VFIYILFYNSTSSITSTQCSASSVPPANSETSVKTWSENPPTFRMSERSLACVLTTITKNGTNGFLPKTYAREWKPFSSTRRETELLNKCKNAATKFCVETFRALPLSYALPKQNGRSRTDDIVICNDVVPTAFAAKL
jgi:hypothetical protein